MKLFCEKSFDLFACEFEKLLFKKVFLKWFQSFMHWFLQENLPYLVGFDCAMLSKLALAI